MALGSVSSSRICGGHWVTRLAHYYGLVTSVMVLILIKDTGITALGKMCVLVRGDDRV